MHLPWQEIKLERFGKGVMSNREPQEPHCGSVWDVILFRMPFISYRCFYLWWIMLAVVNEIITVCIFQFSNVFDDGCYCSVSFLRRRRSATFTAVEVEMGWIGASSFVLVSSAPWSMHCNLQSSDPQCPNAFVQNLSSLWSTSCHKALFRAYIFRRSTCLWSCVSLIFQQTKVLAELVISLLECRPWIQAPTSGTSSCYCTWYKPFCYTSLYRVI